MTNFICKGCGSQKPQDEFYKHAAMKTGHLSFCKTCVKDKVAKNRSANIERIREYDRNRGQLAHRKEAVKRRAPKYEMARRELLKKKRKENPERYRARTALGNAIRNGKILRPSSCQKCGKLCVPQGHHNDYLKPLEVIWVCAKCHGEIHRQKGDLRT